MKPNLLNKDKLIKKKWLKPKYNRTICRFLQGLQYYIYDLNEYNNNPQFYTKTTFLSLIADKIVVLDTKFGIIIEYNNTIEYMLHYYSYSNTDKDFVNIEYLQLS